MDHVELSEVRVGAAVVPIVDDAEAPSSASARAAEEQLGPRFITRDEPPSYALDEVSLDELESLMTDLGWTVVSTSEKPKKPGEDWSVQVNVRRRDERSRDALVAIHCQPKEAVKRSGGTRGSAYFSHENCYVSASVSRPDEDHAITKESAILLEAVLAADAPGDPG